MFSVGRVASTTKFGSGLILSNSRFCHTWRQVLEYADSITCRPWIIGYYQKPINLPSMILCAELDVDMGYIGSKTITIGNWGSL